MTAENADIKHETDRLFEKLKNVTDFKTGMKHSAGVCAAYAPLTLQINRIKKEKDFLILAHYYARPEIVFGVADEAGDSYSLSLKSARAKEKNIIFAGVKFMAETAKIISSDKNVYPAAFNAGCSLADAIDEQTVKDLRVKEPHAAFVCYINSSASVKALCDVCVTSANVYEITAKIPQKKIVFLPDVFMAENIRSELKRRGVEKEILAFGKTCCVHDKYATQDVLDIRLKYPDAKILCHPECAASVCALCDYVGGTGGMLKYARESEAGVFAVLSETGIVSVMEAENSDKTFIPVARVCAQMKKNSLEFILKVLETESEFNRTALANSVICGAKAAVDKMFQMTRRS
jgi:quinolinate synthase